MSRMQHKGVFLSDHEQQVIRDIDQDIKNLVAKSHAVGLWESVASNKKISDTIESSLRKREEAAKLAYGAIDPSKPSAPVELAKLQGREDEISFMRLSISQNAELRKKIDEELGRLVESRTTMLEAVASGSRMISGRIIDQGGYDDDT